MKIQPPPSLSAALPVSRWYTVENETSPHHAELEASSHEHAARCYRQQYLITGYARLKTTEVARVAGAARPVSQKTHYTAATYTVR